MWVSDGSAFESEGGRLTCTTEGQGDCKFNFMWKEGEGVSQGEHYWEVTLENADHAWVGVTTADRLKRGYAGRALNFGGPGNLSEGVSLLAGGWGPEPKAGDTVGVLAECGQSLKVSFFLNSTPLGTAFDVPSPYPSPLFPSVSLNAANQTVNIRKQPPPTERAVPAPTPAGIEGDWQMENPYEPGLVPALHVAREGEGESYRLSVRCANTLWTIATRSPSGQWSVGMCASTMMFSPQWSSTEQHVSGLLSTLTSVELQADGRLRLASPEDSRVFRRHVIPRPAPITSVRF